ncbi:MAG: ATP-dependent DNA helicase RecG [Patescibacteria group bacterium]
MLQWTDPVGFVPGATPAIRKAWNVLGIQTVGDLLLTLPRRYDDYSRIVAIRDAQVGEVVTVRGKIVACGKLPSFRKRFQMIRAKIADETGSLGATFFNQPWLLEQFIVDTEVVFSGKIVVHPRYGKSMQNPLWELAEQHAVAVGKLAPVYPLSGSLAQKTYRRLVLVALPDTKIPGDPLPEDVRMRYELPTFADAIHEAHEPKDTESAEKARERFAFDELLTYQLAFAMARQESNQAGAPIVPFDERFAKRFVEHLTFPLTGDQKRSVWAALQDMGKDKPMRRLLQGDVGSGKTVVAAMLAAHTQRAGSSVAFLVPTDILARQHAVTLRRMFAPHLIPLLLITRTEKVWSYDKEERQVTNAEIEELVAKGHIVIVGTHALLHAKRLPADLGLAIVDEQHRFGVEQREALVVSARSDGRVPHFLSMTATPIPRSLALTLFGDLDVSVIREKPAGRQPVATSVLIGEQREEAYQAIREAVGRKERAFVVCALIDPSDELGIKSATEEHRRLSDGPLKGLRVGLLHGRMKPAEKEQTMTDFAEGRLDVLVSTAVIEVGVDVPQATVMAIEGAERFGMAQLHQFRGRVGRSSLPSRCFLLTDATEDSLARLEIVAQVTDGFILAEEDLKRRGGGSIIGTEQSGHEAFQAARSTDLRLMAYARDEAKTVLEQDPTLEKHAAWHARIKKLRTTSHLE